MSHDTTVPPIAAVSSIRVEDFERWHAAFSTTAHVRKGGGILGHALCRSAEDPSVVFAFFPASDRARLDRFLGDPELPARLRTHGATDHRYFLVVPQEIKSAESGATAAAMVVHDVEDYDRWKAAFDAHAETRRRAGILGHTVTRLAEQPNRVSVFLQAGSADAIQSLLGSDELRASMQKAGAISPPEVTMLLETGLVAQY